ncbi:MAG: hypothetical protein ACI8RZ_003241 [Myxococcota bacterium]|jgi:hypothetical protein
MPFSLLALFMLACASHRSAPLPAPPSSAATPDHQVLFRFDRAGLFIPMACWNDRIEQLVFGAACLERVPPGTEVSLQTGESVTLGIERSVVCDANSMEARS